MPPQRMAASIVRAIERERFAVYRDRGMALLAGLGPPLAPVLRRLMDRKVRMARSRGS